MKGKDGRLRKYLKILGPGLITGASDDDPSGIATYSQAGAGFGLVLLWMAPFTFPLMAAIQGMCARIGLVTCTGTNPHTEKILSAGDSLPDADFQYSGYHLKYRSRYRGHGRSNQSAFPVDPSLCFQLVVYHHPDGLYYYYSLTRKLRVY